MIPTLWSTTGLTTERGHIDRPLVYGRWRVPDAIELRDDRLVWNQGFGDKLARAGAKLLEEFLGLGGQPGERVVAFARRWGVLGICEHGLPSTHNPPPRPPRVGTVPMTWCMPMRADKGWFWEPLDVWQRLSTQFQAVLNLAAQLHQGQLGSTDDWLVLYYNMDIPVPWWTRKIRADRAVLTGVVNEWASISGIQIVSDWRGEKTPTIGLSGGSLFGALILQLTMAVSRTEGLCVCSGCGTTYVPSRSPRADQRHYCDDCRGRRVPVRDAATDYRRRRSMDK